MSASAPPKTFQLISTLLSAGILAGAGGDGSASERQKAQRLSTFQVLMPVSRLALLRCSLARWDRRIVSSDIGVFLPEVAGDDVGGAVGVVVAQLVSPANRRGELVVEVLVDLFVGRQQHHLVADVGEVPLDQKSAVF